MDAIGCVAAAVAWISLCLLAFFGDRWVRVGIAALVFAAWMLAGLFVVYGTFYFD
jgi:hypothetical protein